MQIINIKARRNDHLTYGESIISTLTDVYLYWDDNRFYLLTEKVAEHEAHSHRQNCEEIKQHNLGNLRETNFQSKTHMESFSSNAYGSMDD